VTPSRHSASGAKRRVVVTGAGIITALGAGWRANATGFQNGAQGFRPVTLFDTIRHRAKTAAEINDDWLEAPPAAGAKKHVRHRARLDRAARMLLTAGIEAAGDAHLESGQTLPLVLGTTSGGMMLGEDFYRTATGAAGPQSRQPARIVHYQCQRQALELQSALGVNGPITIIANACASGANAVGHAFHCVRDGLCERALCGGYDALSLLVFSGFDSLQALSTTTCRPFDAHRDGLALGEGAAVFVIETLDSAMRRGTTVLGELCGYGMATDVHHLTQPHPAGDAALASMNAACRDAGVQPSRIGYINAHGTGTPLNDNAEAAAINRWAGEQAAAVPVSSTKASIGHLLGAAGAVEVAVCLMALRGGWLPPMTHLQTPDPACAFPLVREARSAGIEHALTNSFGFGGANATLVLRRWA